ncbi:flavin reductase like domain-containing protein [Xylaria palmicola]|nr:flavin reductase like domain-containing protein [Xylaria palmicola]
MQSIRGLRRAIPPISPRHAFTYCPCRGFKSSPRRSGVEQSPPNSDVVEQLTTLRGRNESLSAGAIEETQPPESTDERNVPFRAVGASETTDPQPADPSAHEYERNSRQGARDLCGSVTAAMAKLPHPAVVITTLDRTYHAQATAGVPISAMRHPIARGITVSSFTSLGIRPAPHVMFNMTLPSTMYEALVACRDFNVHVLTPDKAGARVASVFTRGNRLPPPRIGGASSGCAAAAADYAFDIDADLGVFVGLKDRGFRHIEIANRDAWHEQYQDAKERGLRAPASLRGVDSAHAADGPVRQVHHVPCLRSRGIMEVLHCRLVRAMHPELPNAGQNVVMIGEVIDVTFPRQSDVKLDRMPIALGYADRKYRSVGDAIHPHEVDDLDDET